MAKLTIESWGDGDGGNGDLSPLDSELRALGFEITTHKAVITAPGLRLTTKLIDGTYPNWRVAHDKAVGEGGLQRVAMIELDYRLNAPLIAKLAKAAGVELMAETGETAAVLTAADYPEYVAVTMFMRDGANPKGYGFNAYEYADAIAVRYMATLAEARGLDALPLYRLHRDGDLITGATFGEGELIWPEPVTRLCYESFTEIVEYPEPFMEWTSGPYDIEMPATHAALVTAEINGHGANPIRTNAKGEIELNAAAVADMCGDPACFDRVEIATLQFLHGEIVAGYTFPGAPKVAGKGRRMRTMSDREQTDAYNRDPAAFMASIRARAPGEIEAVIAIGECAAVDSNVVTVDFAGHAAARVEAEADAVPVEDIQEPEIVPATVAAPMAVHGVVPLYKDETAAAFNAVVASAIAIGEFIRADAEPPAAGDLAALQAENSALRAVIDRLEARLASLEEAVRQPARAASEPLPASEPIVIEATFDAYGHSYSTPLIAGFVLGGDQVARIAELEAQLAESQAAGTVLERQRDIARGERDKAQGEAMDYLDQAQQNAERAVRATTDLQISEGELSRLRRSIDALAGRPAPGRERVTA